MSSESSAWLNNNIMVGMGKQPWWLTEEGLKNLYPGALERTEIRSKLLDWVPVSKPIYDEDMKPIDGYQRLVPSDDKKATLAIHTTGYAVHDYSEMLGASALDIVSCGLLKSRKIFWVTYGKDETIHTPEGVDFLPYITNATSLDGSLSTTANDHVTFPVCDNTLGTALMQGLTIKVRHSSNSGSHWLDDMTTANARLANTANAMMGEIASLCAVKVSEAAWQALLNEHTLTKLPEKALSKTGGPGRAYTMAENRRVFMDELYRNDARVSPWTGTAFGVVQAFNTYANHHTIIQGGSDIGASAARVQRNMLRTVKGEWAAIDEGTMKVLDKVLAAV